jgi:hypothetical protein
MGATIVSFQKEAMVAYHDANSGTIERWNEVNTVMEKVTYTLV